MSTVPTVEKCPAQYRPYRCVLSKEEKELARIELHEDDNTREPSVAQMREFIAKHPQIVRCRTDAPFLLRYLRYNKFNVSAACAMLEHSLYNKKKYAAFYSELDPLLPELDEALDRMGIVPLGVDSKNRCVFTYRMAAYDPSVITSQVQSRQATMIFEAYIEKEETQVHGCVLILDFLDITMSHLSVWSLSDLKMLMEVVNNVMTVRLKEIHIIQLPKYATMLMDFCFSLMSAKMRQRIKFHPTLEDVQRAIDLSNLPTIYGGNLSLQAANADLKAYVRQQRDWIVLPDQFQLDTSRPPPKRRTGDSHVEDDAVIGSFRKLNVD